METETLEVEKKTKERFDAQKVVNTVVAGLASQGFEKSAVSGLGCAYLSDDGKRCAAGWLIPKDKYKSEFEGLRIRALLVEHPDILPEWAVPDDAIDDWSTGMDLLSSLQWAHDDALNPANMRERLREVIKRNGLAIPQALWLADEAWEAPK